MWKQLTQSPVVFSIPLALAAVGLSLAGDTRPPCLYSASHVGDGYDCGPFDGPRGLQPRALNNFGNWAGKRTRCESEGNTTLPIAIHWTPELGVQVLPTPPDSTWSEATGINDAGIVVGWRNGTLNGESGWWGCVWTDAGLIDIPHHPLGDTSFAFAVNNSGIVVGYRDLTSGPVERLGFVWDAGKIVDISPAPFGRSKLEARAISNSGWVAGHLGLDTSVNAHAIRWRDGKTELLGVLAGSVASRAYGVNNIGQVAGSCRFAVPELPGYRYQPVIWTIDGGPHELPLLPLYTGGTAIAINDAGVVLGYMTAPPGTGLFTRRCLWIGGQPHWLSEVVDDPTWGPYMQGIALNDFGEVLTTGPSQTVNAAAAYVLTPQLRSPADLTNDCVVDGSDLGVLLNAWGPCSTTAPADLDKNLIVNGADLGLLLGAWTIQ